MAISAKYGKVTVEREPGNPFGEDEPVFLLRARDSASATTLEYYLTLMALLDTTPEHILSVKDVIDTFRDWRENNIELVKVPD